MTSLLELAERVEKLDGPDRVIDSEIARLAGACVFRCVNGEWPYAMPKYTASIDSAMALVPGKLYWQITCGIDDVGLDRTSPRTFSAMLTDEWNDASKRIWAASPALALCAAALRARAQAQVSA